jgi:hypothetical protein
VTTLAGSLRAGWKTLLDGSFDRLECPSCSQISGHYAQSQWHHVRFETIHVRLHDELKRIVTRALLLEDTRDSGEESCGLLAQLREAFAVLLDDLSSRSASDQITFKG